MDKGQSNNMGYEQLPLGTSTCWGIIEELNSTYEERLTEIDERTKGHPQTKIAIYKEWVEVLKGLIWDSMETLKELEHEATERLNTLQNKINSGCGEEITRLRKDVNSLLTLIKRAVENEIWCVNGLEFRTITLEDIFGKKVGDLPFAISPPQEQETITNKQKCQDKTGDGNDLSCECIESMKELLKNTLRDNEKLQNELKAQKQNKEQTMTSMKALATEVAEKHDKLQDLKNHILSLEEEVRHAEKKIQFKDNVIKELRRDLRIASKYPDSKQRKRSIGGIVTVDEDQLVVGRKQAESSSEMAKPVEISEKVSSSLSDTDLCLENVIERESTRIREFEEKEEEYFQLLNSELNDIWKTYMGKGDFQDQKDIIIRHSNKINKVIQDLLKDLSCSRKKLNFVRLQLRYLIGDPPSDGANIDSGYTSQEEYEPESSMITAVNDKLLCLAEENKDLKQKLQDCRKTMQRNGESYEYRRKAEEQRRIALENNDAFQHNKIFEAISFTLSQVMKKQTHVNNENELCNALKSLEVENDEKENLINTLKSDIEKLQENINTFEKCSKEKEQTINQLKEIVGYHKDSEKIFEKSEKKLKGELNTTKEEPDNYADFRKVLEEKQALEIECQNQRETIKNLRLALETLKRNSGNSGLSANNGNSLWGWWRASVHDV